MKLQRSLAAEAEAAREARAKVFLIIIIKIGDQDDHGDDIDHFDHCPGQGSFYHDDHYFWWNMIVMVILMIIMIIINQVIVAEGEIKASLALRQAAENIAGSPESLQVSLSM